MAAVGPLPLLATREGGGGDALLPTLAPEPGPVGGRLRDFVGSWSEITSDAWVLATVEHGYCLEFTSTPPSDTLVRETPVPANREKRLALEKEISSLLEKQAVRPVADAEQFQGFLSTFFLTPKKGTMEWRPIINLKPLNRFIRPRRFRMETLKVILESLPKAVWAASIDLRDAYLHIPISSGHSRYLRFRYRGRTLEFTALPFGLSTSPRAFTRVTRAIAAYLRRRNIMIYMYLDDWLIVGRSEEETAQYLQTTCEVTRAVGFIINEEKSRFIPTQSPTFLGAVIDLRNGIAFPTTERITALYQCVDLFLSSTTAPARAWLKLLGFMASLVDLVPWCRLRMRPLQLHLLSHFRPKRDYISILVPISSHILPHLRWWQKEENVNCGLGFPPRAPQVTILTDASNKGWGASLGPRQTAGVWDKFFKSQHINILELQAVINALRHFQTEVRNRAVLIRTDNTTVVSYINRQGGTRSPQLCLLTWDLNLWLIENETTLHAIHIPGVENTIADALSRGTVIPTEWTLHNGVTQQIFATAGRPHIDLFATEINAKLPVFCARFHHPRAWATDALAIDWTGMFAYAFPPISLLQRVIGKIEQESCRILLIAPFWPRQPWFLRLVRLLVGDPLILPDRHDLLYQPHSRLLHPAPGDLHLACWPLSNDPSLQLAFLKRLRPLQRRGVASPHERFTTTDFNILVGGVTTALWIRPLHL